MSKLVLRVFNGIIMAIAALACVLLFVTPTFSFFASVGFDIKTFSEFVPATEYTGDLNVAQMLGTDEIRVGLQFEIRFNDVNNIVDGKRETINEKVISKSMDDVINTLHEPVDLIVDYALKTNLKNLVKTQITSYVDQARQKYSSDKSLEDILDDVGMDDDYFKNFSIALYQTANSDDCTVESLGDFMFNQIDEAMAMADDSRAIDSSEFNEETRTDARAAMVNVLNQLHLVEDDGVNLKKLTDIPYIYLTDFIKQDLAGKVSEEELAKTSSETYFEYSDRLLEVYVLNKIPEQAYAAVGYFGIGCIVGMFTFAIIWVILFGWTLYKTLTPKPWTKFGFWFWIVGGLQLILGIGITIVGKVIIPMISLKQYNIPINKIYLVPRTFALWPSILFLICIGLGIAYAVIRSGAKREAKKNG